MDLPFITQLINSRLNATLLGSCPQPTLRCPNLWGSGPRSLFLWSRVGAEGGMAWAHPCSGFSPLGTVKTFGKDLCFRGRLKEAKRLPGSPGIA